MMWLSQTPVPVTPSPLALVPGYATPLARYAVAQYHAGRHVGCQLNLHDVTSMYRQQRHEVAVATLSPRAEDGRWLEILVEDRSSTRADIAASRIDFRAWLRCLPRPKRAAVKLLAGRATTIDAAKHLKLSQARVSQLRRKLKEA